MASRAPDWMVGIGLLVSLAGNAHLLGRGQAQRSAAPTSASPAAAPASDTHARRTIAASWHQTLPGLRRNTAAGAEGKPVRLDACELRRTALTAQLAELEQLQKVRLPPAKRFATASANPTLTAAFSAALAAQIAKEGGERRALAVECHDRLCRLTLPKDANPSELLARITHSEWMSENLHEVARDGAGVLYAQHTPGAVRSSDLLQQAVQDFEGSGAPEACQAQFGRVDSLDVGTLDAQLSLAASEQDTTSGEAAEIVAGGRLAGTPLGNCIDAEFRKALRERTLPPHYESASLLAQFPKR
jgi:hypothetical protein